MPGSPQNPAEPGRKRTDIMTDITLPFDPTPYDRLPVSVMIYEPVYKAGGALRDFRIVYGNEIFARDWMATYRDSAFVGACLKDLVGLSGRDAHHIGVLPVDDGKGNAHHFLIRLEVLLQKGDASLTDHVAHSQNIDRHAIILRSVPLQFPIV